jgi:hypothetical protein
MRSDRPSLTGWGRWDSGSTALDLSGPVRVENRSARFASACRSLSSRNTISPCVLVLDETKGM